MGVDKAIDITAKQREIILLLLHSYLPDTTVWAFGSRVKFTSRPDSDLDLVAFIKLEQQGQLAEFKEALDESDVPFRVDVLDWDSIPESFKRNIEKEYVVLWEVEEGCDEKIGWKRCKLGEICEKIGSGATPRGGKEAYMKKGEISLIRSQNVVDFRFSSDGLAFIDENQANELKNVIVEESDVLLNITGDSVARVCQAPNDVLPARVNQHVAIIRPKDNELDRKFLKYALLNPSFKNFMLALASTGGTRNALTKGMIENFEIFAPESIKEQQSIASILSSLDDKIELNLQMNQTLEAIAQAIYKEWFVNFNFPGFDGQLVDGLPKKWKYLPISKVGTVITGKTPSSNNPEHFGNTIPFVTPSDFKNYGKLIIDAERYLSEDGANVFTNKLLPRNSLIVTCIDSDMGKVAINKVECITNQQINSIIPAEGIISTDYLYYELLNKYEYLKNLATGGSTMPIINKTQFEQIEILVPQFDIVTKFQELADSFNGKIEENVKQIKILTKIRESLLPKLMTGKIEVNHELN